MWVCAPLSIRIPASVCCVCVSTSHRLVSVTCQREPCVCVRELCLSHVCLCDCCVVCVCVLILFSVQWLVLVLRMCMEVPRMGGDMCNCK